MLLLAAHSCTRDKLSSHPWSWCAGGLPSAAALKQLPKTMSVKHQVQHEGSGEQGSWPVLARLNTGNCLETAQIKQM